MKRLLLISLLLAGCGDKATVEPVPTPTPTPAPVQVEASLDDALVGNWIDEDNNTLKFKDDGTVTSNEQSLEWKIDSHELVFTAAGLEIDSCDYDILSSGGLRGDLVITLDLGCLKAGQITYTKD